MMYKQYILLLYCISEENWTKSALVWKWQKMKRMIIKTNKKQNIKFDFGLYNNLDMILKDSPLE